jgi:HD-GYP domain-containing protein (c-di-GMP phosphodiesterase class II)
MSCHSDLDVPIFDLITCLSETIDLVSPEMADHHHRVGLIAWALARRMEFPEERQTNLLFAGNLHDIGALSLTERLRLLNFDAHETLDHSETGALLLEMFAPLAEIADMVRFHHVRWKDGQGAMHRGRKVPLEAHILHLADRIAVLLGTMDKARLLCEVRNIRDRIESESGTMFSPELVAVFRTLAGQESFWLGIAYPQRNTLHEQQARLRTVRLDTDGLLGLSRMFARIIDFKSRFTATHSSGVAASAESLARLAGMSPVKCRQMRIAGLLHDLGKLAVPTEVLEKPGPLTDEERSIICCHTYFTDRALQNISSFGEIAKWSSYHHERLDGTGYPYHIDSRDLPLGSRIVSVSDVFTAITEDRPYRAGMDRNKATDVLTSMVSRSALDPAVVALLMDNYDDLNAIRAAAQQEAAEEYGELRGRVSSAREPLQ